MVNTSFFPDLSIQLSKRRSRCVLDPNLALSPGGASLARLLAPYVELWVGPEIFNVIDSATLYQREPELLIWPGTDQTEVAAVPEVLRDWVQLREEAGRYLYWVGDALRESFLPEDFDESLLSRWEAASRTLDSRLPQAMEATGPLIAAMRDAAALCAVLPSASIVSRGRRGELPSICRHLQQWGLVCEKLAPEDALASIERTAFLQLLVTAGLAPLIWGGLQIVVVHLSVPHVGRLDPASGIGCESTMLAEEPCIALPHPWEGARCFCNNVV